jgi:hypothetical protein
MYYNNWKYKRTLRDSKEASVLIKPVDSISILQTHTAATARVAPS